MFEKLTDYCNDHPVLYIVGAVVLTYTALDYLHMAGDCLTAYGNAREISRQAWEASEALRD